MEYHPYITEARRSTTAAERMEVFGAGTDPAGLGTLGAPVNADHVFEYLGENLPPFGNPRAIVDAGANSWENGFNQVYGGQILKQEAPSRFHPNTKTYTVNEPMAVMGRDEMNEVKNNSQILAEKRENIGSVRYFPMRQNANDLANKVSADAELRELQGQAVAMVHEAQMDAIRAGYSAAKARGAAIRGNVGAMVPPINTPTVKMPLFATSTKSIFAKTPTTPMAILPSRGNNFGTSTPRTPANPVTSTSSGAPVAASSYDEVLVDDGGYMAASYEEPVTSPVSPVSAAGILLGVAAVAGIGLFLVLRKGR
jgi:hypothetical protein